MTKEEFLEKYGEVVVKFDSYYKYTFTYKAILDDGSALLVSYGGNPDDIYRHEVSHDDVIQVSVLDPFAGEVYKNHELTEFFYDY